MFQGQICWLFRLEDDWVEFPELVFATLYTWSAVAFAFVYALALEYPAYKLYAYV